MQRLHKQQWLEQSTYAILWLAVFLFPLLGACFAVNGGVGKEEVYNMICHSWLNILPFWGLFLLNNYLLVPFFLFKKKYGLYTLYLILTVGATCWLIPPPMEMPFQKENRHTLMTKGQYRDQIIEQRERKKADTYRNPEKEDEIEMKSQTIDHSLGTDVKQDKRPAPYMKRLPFPPAVIRYLIHMVTAFLMAGFNIAIKLFFKSVRDEELLKELEHQRLQSELQYLKYQINPHFFMNTLNNIHALVDINTDKAKGSIVELSKLMRYVLYEASNKTILLSREIQFLENYIALMSLRFTDKVLIDMQLPQEVPDVQIPPLLFISFIENAFKHGVSYRKDSFIRIRMQMEESNRLSFRCSNSCGGNVDEQHHGIGLENVRKRLRLLFENNYTLSIKEGKDKFDVLLIIPLL